jgi:hypothetical protein
MIEVLPDSQEDVLIVKATGKLTDKDYKEVLIPRLESIFHEHGKARFLVELDDEFRGWEAAAAWDDLRFGLAHRRDFAKMGVVGRSQWIRPVLKLTGWLMCGDIESFFPSECGRALEWIKAR